MRDSTFYISKSYERYLNKTPDSYHYIAQTRIYTENLIGTIMLKRIGVSKPLRFRSVLCKAIEIT